MKNLLILLCACFVLLTGVSMTSAATFSEGENPTVSESVNDDAFVAGDSVTVSAPIMGELFAAGNNVTISKKPSRSVFAAGEIVTISDGSSYNVFAAGKEVTIKGDIAHDVFVAGSKVIIDPSATINGTLHIAGNQLTISGTIKGNVQVSGTFVTSNAVVGGNFQGDANSLTFTGGSIGGDLNYKSPSDAQGLSAVTVAGETTRSEHSRTSFGAQTFQSAFLGGLVTLVTAMALLLLVPKKVEEEVVIAQTKWLKSLGIGFITLFIAPIAAMILAVTVVGGPLGAILFALYLMALYGAFVLGQFILGAWILKLIKVPVKDERPYLAYTIVVGVVVTALLTAIPGIGMFMMFLFFVGLMVPALGAIVQWMQGFIREQTNK